MPPTKALFETYLESIHKTPTPTINVAMGMLKTAAVSFDHLTNDPHWDRFLSLLQAKYEDAKKERDRWKELMTLSFSDSGLREAQCAYHGFRAQVELLEYILGLPHEIRNSYEENKVKS